MEWKKYRRTNIAEMTPWTPSADMRSISVSEVDARNGSPRDGDMIARNPKNHADKWLIAADYFRDNFEPLPELPAPETEKIERICDIIREHKDDHPENVLHRVATELRAMGYDVFAPVEAETCKCRRYHGRKMDIGTGEQWCSGCGLPITIKPDREL